MENWAIALVGLLAIILELGCMMVCVRDIRSRSYFRFLRPELWLFIVIFGNVIGQAAYFFLEFREAR